MNKACLIVLMLLPVTGAVAVQDVAVDVQAALGKPPRALHLEPVESLSIPQSPDAPSGLVSRVHLYVDKAHGSGENSLYLVAEMNYRGEDEDQPHIVGIFAGSRAGEEPALRLSDLDGDGIPELVLVHEAGAGAFHLRVFRISREAHAGDDGSCITASPMLKQVGCVIASLGTIAIERDGTVVSRCYTDESRRQLTVQKYRLKKGEDEMKPEGPGEVKAVEFRNGAPVFPWPRERPSPAYVNEAELPQIFIDAGNK